MWFCFVAVLLFNLIPQEKYTSYEKKGTAKWKEIYSNVKIIFIYLNFH
jgi:hypothetical protein